MRRTKGKRHVTSKWGKTKVLLKSPGVRPSIPDTRKMTRHSLLTMLKNYGMVYIKPNKGTFGIGVMRIEMENTGGGLVYSCQSGTKAQNFRSYASLYRAIRRLTGGRLYLVQKGIHLLKYKGRRFDIRVMAQHNLKHRWEATGVVGRLAAPKKVVTNIHNGGTVKPVGRLLKGHLPSERRRELLTNLRSLGVTVAKQLSSRYPGIREVGLDVALDETLHPWILEVNTRPDPFIFKELKNKRIFGRIKRYAKAYGRL